MLQNVPVKTGPAGAIKLWRARADRQWTQDDLARRTGLNRERISRLETGKAWPKKREIEALARVFGVTFGEMSEWLAEAQDAAERPDLVPAQEATA